MKKEIFFLLILLLSVNLVYSLTTIAVSSDDSSAETNTSVINNLRVRKLPIITVNINNSLVNEQVSNAIKTITSNANTVGVTNDVNSITVIKNITSKGEVVKTIIVDNTAISETTNSVAVLINNNLSTISVASNIRTQVQNKLLIDEMKPLINASVISKLNDSQPLMLFSEFINYWIEINTDCSNFKISGARIIQNITTNNHIFYLIRVPKDNLKLLLENDCIVKVSDESGKNYFLEYVKEELRKEAVDYIREQNLTNTRGVSETITGLKNVVEEDSGEVELPGELVSHYQTFVTPENPPIKNLANGRSEVEIYNLVSSYTWMSDEVLNNEVEKWLKPGEFITNTPYYPNNPLGEVASDCSEQANTLVSLLRASGVNPEKVRVVIGIVNFTGSAGGHAWAEIYNEGNWMVLDPTGGSYYDEQIGRKIPRIGTPYNYWKLHEYSVVEVWAYYNDYYYLEPNGTISHAPESWGSPAGTIVDNTFTFGSNINLFGEFWYSIVNFIIELLNL